MSTTTSPVNVKREIALLQKLTITQLRDRYAEVFGEPTRSGNREFLLKRIAWRLQAQAEGDLSERARSRAAELANDADLRLNPPRSAPTPVVVGRIGSAPGNLSAGTLLTRTYKGRTIQVGVLEDGFEFDGERYRSLSAVARAVTGSHLSGHAFFGLTTRREATA